MSTATTLSLELLSPTAQELARFLLDHARGDDEAPAGLETPLAYLCQTLLDGSSCLTLADLAELLGALASGDAPPDAAQTFVERLEAAGLAARHTPGGDDTDPAATLPDVPFVIDGERLYTARLARSEIRLAARLRKRLGTLEDAGSEAAQRLLDALGKVEKIKPNDAQSHAIRAACGRRLFVLTGGPGTGKTWTVAHLLAAALLAAGDEQLQVRLLAPTGKAAQRLGEALQEAAQTILKERENLPPEITAVYGSITRLAHQTATIHRALRAAPRHDDELLLDVADLVVVDEVSMVDLELMRRLVEHLREEARLILVGDPRQLASVEVGTVLADLVRALEEPREGKLASPALVRLTESQRVKTEGRGIVELARAIEELEELPAGELEHAIGQILERLAEGMFAEGTTANPTAGVTWRELTGGADDAPRLEVLRKAGKTFRDLASQEDPGAALDALTEAIVLTPLRRGRWGQEGLNAWFTRHPKLQKGFHPWIVLRNDYRHGVFNGEVGVAHAGDGGKEERRLYLPAAGNASGSARAATGASRELRSVPLRAVAAQRAFAITIHKSQGSEYDTVYLLLPRKAEVSAGVARLLTRELLYTAITRAKRRVEIVADRETLEHMLATPIRRASGLTERLRGALG